MSSIATTTFEDVCQAAPNTQKWFQMYIYKREYTKSLIRRVENAGFKAIVLTVDEHIAESNKRRSLAFDIKYVISAVK